MLVCFLNKVNKNTMLFKKQIREKNMVAKLSKAQPVYFTAQTADYYFKPGAFYPQKKNNDLYLQY
jgi:hypothetical protein